MMNLKTLALASALIALPCVAFADDMTSNDWTGLYVGADIGAQFSHAHFALPGDTHDALQQKSDDHTSFTGGGLVGYNFLTGNALIGIEGDAMAGGGTSSVTACTVPDGCFTSAHDSFTTLNHLKTDWSGRIRARVGFFADAETLVYGAAGYSYADTKLSLIGLCYDFSDPSVPEVFHYGKSKGLSGFNVGVGIERQFDDHFSGRLEYVYDDFGGNTYPGSVEWNDRRISANDGTLRAAVLYRF
jgi:outer membrane immunogenic protein